jgi:chromosomal replication initiator protein
MELPRTIYETWVRDVEVARFEAPDTVLLRAGNSYAKEWLEDRVSSTAQRVLAGVVGRPMRIEFTVVD